jgi:hypothetical protein
LSQLLFVVVLLLTAKNHFLAAVGNSVKHHMNASQAGHDDSGDDNHFCFPFLEALIAVSEFEACFLNIWQWPDFD